MTEQILSPELKEVLDAIIYDFMVEVDGQMAESFKSITKIDSESAVQLASVKEMIEYFMMKYVEIDSGSDSEQSSASTLSDELGSDSDEDDDEDENTAGAPAVIPTGDGDLIPAASPYQPDGTHAWEEPTLDAFPSASCTDGACEYEPATDCENNNAAEPETPKQI